MSLKKQVIVYVADIRPLYEEALLKKAYKLADKARRQKADMYIGKERRAACLAAGLLADEAKRRCGYGDCPVRFTQQGQPYLEIPEGRKKAWISISHSGDYAACAVGYCPVGVDIQKETTVRERIGERCYAPGERQDFGEGLDKKDFFRRWTVKESYMKLTGAGMALGFSNLFADMDARTVYETEYLERKACFRECRAPEGYFLSVCFVPEDTDGQDDKDSR